jgi:multidrug transporter EmrE-like cation transporter
MIYPSVKAMGEDKAEKIFYLTAKTITRTVAEESFTALQSRGLDLLAATITAKEKVCVLEKPNCNPESCPRANGHFDRINDAVFYAINNYKSIGRKEVFYGFLVGIPNFYSSKFILRALEVLDGVIIYPSFSVGTLLVVTIAGIIFFHERLRKLQWIAVALIIVALVLLNI